MHNNKAFWQGAGALGQPVLSAKSTDATLGGSLGGTGTAKVCTSVACSPADMALYQANAWFQDIKGTATYPGASTYARIPNFYQVTVTCSAPVAKTNTPTDCTIALQYLDRDQSKLGTAVTQSAAIASTYQVDVLP